MQRMPMMVGNWKMNNTIAEAVVLAQDISNEYEQQWRDRVDVVVCPPFLDIKPVRTVFDFDRTTIYVGAQDVHWELKGAYTGEVSVPMLTEAGATYCIVGHSERRELFGETNEQVNKKVKALLDARIAPIVCVGESLAVHDAGQTADYVTAEVRAAFAGIDDWGDAVVAYEPIWAIGTGRTAAPEQAQEVCALIRSVAVEEIGAAAAEALRVLYGGSMNPGNVQSLIDMPDVDGGLVGGASLERDSFMRMVRACL